MKDLNLFKSCLQIMIALLILNFANYYHTLCYEKVPYRLGNYIDHWYNTTYNPWFYFGSMIACTKKEGFVKYLSDNPPIDYKSPQRTLTSLKYMLTYDWTLYGPHLYWWCYDYEQYKYLYPHFNTSIRHAIRNYFGEKYNVYSNTCVVHYRIGDALCHGKDIWSWEKVFECIKYCFSKYHHIQNIVFMDGGKNFSYFCKTNNDIKNPLDILKEKVAEYGIPILENKGKSADEDFIQMVKAPLLITGVGSFASIAAAANTNIRYTPNLYNILGENIAKRTNIKHVYENWYTYG